MKVLLLSPWFPVPAYGGALIRVLETLRHLGARHDVTLLAPVAAPPERASLETLEALEVATVTVVVPQSAAAVAGRLARGLLAGRPLIQGLHIDARLAEAVQRLTASERYDIVHVEHSFMAPYLNHVSPRCGARTVLSMHNVESLRFTREMHVARWGTRRVALAVDHYLFGAWEAAAVARFHGIAAVSPLEEAWVHRHAPGAAVVLAPNGVRTDRFRPASRIGGAPQLVFPGLMNYPPNVDAVNWFCDAVLPLVAKQHPGVSFSIVGDKPVGAVRALARRPGVTVTGAVADIRPHLARAAAVVVPLRSGGGTRLKILEAMAMARPVVTTSQGAEGLAVTPGVDVLVGDSPEAFASHVCAVLANPPEAERLGREGRRLVEERYDWRVCLAPLDDLYERVTASDGRGTAEAAVR